LAAFSQIAPRQVKALELLVSEARVRGLQFSIDAATARSHGVAPTADTGIAGIPEVI
jgi:hypothetical protein